MSNVQEIESAIRQLTPDELAAFRDWYAHFDAEAWDRQLEADVAGGKLDSLAAGALDDLDQGKCEKL